MNYKSINMSKKKHLANIYIYSTEGLGKLITQQNGRYHQYQIDLIAQNNHQKVFFINNLEKVEIEIILLM